MSTIVTVTGSALSEAATWASRVVPARPALPLLGGLLLDAADDQLTISAFDYEVAVTATVPAVVREPGRLLLSARLLVAIAKTVARDVDVTIEVDGRTTSARCGRSVWSLPTMDAEDYPGLPALAEPIGEVDAQSLRRALARVLPAVHTGGGGEATANLAGVKLDGGPDGLTLAATDRYRVAVAELEWKPTSGVTVDALVPAEPLEAMARAAGSGTVALFCGDSTFGLEADAYRVVGRQIAQRYPDLSRFMPVLGEHYAVIDVADLSRAVDEAMVMLDKEPAVRLGFEPESVEVSVTGDDRRATASARLHALHGEPVEIGVNAEYLRTALRLLESEAAILHFAGRARMLLALPCDAQGVVTEGYRHVVVAMRLPDAP